MADATMYSGKVLRERYIGWIDGRAVLNPPSDALAKIKADGVIVTDGDEQPILIVEFCFKNKVDNEKIAKLDMLGIPAIEIYLTHIQETREIDELLRSDRNRRWLYHPRQHQSPSTGTLLYGVAAQLDADERPISKETVKCRSIKVEGAIRQIRDLAQRGYFTQYQSSIIDTKEGLKIKQSELESEQTNIIEQIQELNRELQQLEIEQGRARHEAEVRALEDSGINEIKEDIRSSEELEEKLRAQLDRAEVASGIRAVEDQRVEIDTEQRTTDTRRGEVKTAIRKEDSRLRGNDSLSDAVSRQEEDRGVGRIRTAIAAVRSFPRPLDKKAPEEIYQDLLEHIDYYALLEL